MLSIPHYVIKNGRPHGARHGKTDAQKEHFVAHNARKRCIKKNYDEIHDRFQKDFHISCLATQNWSNWRNMHPDGRGGAERFHLSHVVRRVHEIQKELVDLSQHRWNSDQTSAKHWQNCTVFTVSLEKSDLHRFFSGSIRKGILRLLHPAHHGGSGTVLGGAHKIHQMSAPLSSWNERHHRTGRAVKRLLH